MKIKCIFLLHLFLISAYSNGAQPESDLTKVSKQIQLTAEIKKNNRSFGDFVFNSHSPLFKALTWDEKQKKFLDLKLLFSASNTAPVKFNVNLENFDDNCGEYPRIPSPSKKIKTISVFILDVNGKSRVFRNNKIATIETSDWPGDNSPYSVNFTVRGTFNRINNAPRLCTGTVTIVFSIPVLP